MCNETRVWPRAPGAPRVRWGRLYAILAVMGTALASVEVVGSAGLSRTALRGGITLVAFAAMAFWVRANRAAFDYADWCECAAAKITVRVISSRPPEPELPPLEDDDREWVPEREGVLT